jgi:hypothetical protein
VINTLQLATRKNLIQMSPDVITILTVIINYQLHIKICYYIQYVHIRAKNFLVQCYFTNGERLENGEWSHSTPRVFEEFQQKFPDFQGTH